MSLAKTAWRKPHFMLKMMDSHRKLITNGSQLLPLFILYLNVVVIITADYAIVTLTSHTAVNLLSLHQRLQMWPKGRHHQQRAQRQADFSESRESASCERFAGKYVLLWVLPFRQNVSKLCRERQLRYILWNTVKSSSKMMRCGFQLREQNLPSQEHGRRASDGY